MERQTTAKLIIYAATGINNLDRADLENYLVILRDTIAQVIGQLERGTK